VLLFQVFLSVVIIIIVIIIIIIIVMKGKISKTLKVKGNYLESEKFFL